MKIPPRELTKDDMIATNFIKNKPTRTDILNVIRIVKPTKKELRKSEPPDMHKVVENQYIEGDKKYAVHGLISGMNIDEEDEAEIHQAIGKEPDTLEPPPGSKTVMNKLQINSLAEVGFQNFRKDQEDVPEFDEKTKPSEIEARTQEHKEK